MNIIHKKDFKQEEPLKLSQVDNVNRSGYVPLDITYERMRLAGIKLDKIRDEQYNFELKDFIDKGLSIDEYSKDILLKSRFNDKTALDDMYKAKLKKYEHFKDTQEQLKALHEEYLRELEEKEKVASALRNYKAEKEKPQQE